MTAPRRLDLNTMATNCRTVSDALDSSVLLVGSTLEKYRNLDTADVHLFRDGDGPLPASATTAALLHITSELETVLDALRLADDRLRALLPLTSQMYPPASPEKAS